MRLTLRKKVNLAKRKKDKCLSFRYKTFVPYLPSNFFYILFLPFYPS